MKKWMGKPYHHLNAFFHEKFGEKVYRVSIDAGFTCPNRDGTKGTGGCIYCNEAGARAAYVNPEQSVTLQLQSGTRLIRERTKAKKFIAYFQAYTNTYAPAEKLEKIYMEALSVPDIVGISIGTRPDCIDDEVLGLLEKIADSGRYVLIEYGVQSMKDKTLTEINRGHSVKDTVEALEKTKKRAGIDILAHVIFGLPGENAAEMAAGVDALVRLGVHAFKFHHLYVERNTLLEEMCYTDRVKILSQEEYLEVLLKVIPRLPESAVIHRLFGQCSKENLIAPLWTLDKNRNTLLLEKKMEERNCCQGCQWVPPAHIK